MIVQACLNGARPADFHPDLPLTAAAMARQGAACIAAGAAELHIHPRNADGSESLEAVDETMLFVRQACPGIPVGVSTGEWIEGDAPRTLRRIEAWRDLPDYASVNLSEQGAADVMAALHRIGVGIEAGLSSTDDAERFVAVPGFSQCLRVLIEVEEQEMERARHIVDDVASVLVRAGCSLPILLHGFDATVWPLIDLADQRGWSTRVGFEDGKLLPDGKVATSNAMLVGEAVRNMRQPKIAMAGAITC
ncbi:Uncharacterized conserved protein, DUF849 family [Sphingomonas gellani]|uniref:Uncharacterized conserved protein, DUF849 family n=1 Tax=Sphingomonas gellani TaxID=1166340 RepID=A0A1H8IHS6_9SPHN|nr:3-keto-5-aminohexanoate cleavage protein [Sphingomonas gellani]SEN68253.1 Uncharacterized conserved protein, DUF849 family [Sphingomonas gellani]